MLKLTYSYQQRQVPEASNESHENEIREEKVQILQHTFCYE